MDDAERLRLETELRTILRDVQREKGSPEWLLFHGQYLDDEELRALDEKWRGRSEPHG